jgi:hypothetical protein
VTFAVLGVQDLAQLPLALTDRFQILGVTCLPQWFRSSMSDGSYSPHPAAESYRGCNSLTYAHLSTSDVFPPSRLRDSSPLQMFSCVVVIYIGHNETSQVISEPTVPGRQGESNRLILIKGTLIGVSIPLQSFTGQRSSRCLADAISGHKRALKSRFKCLFDPVKMSICSFSVVRNMAEL